MKNNDILGGVIAEKNKSLKVSFLAEWNPAQFKAMQRAISRHFSTKAISTSRGEYPAKYRSFEGLGDIMGFAYTSSSSYAGYWICNLTVFSPKYPGYEYVGFAMTEAGQPYAILWDKDENEILRTI